MAEKLVCLSLGKKTLNVKSLPGDCLVFASYDDYLAAEIEAGAFVIESASNELGLETLKLLRTNIKTFLLPVFLFELSGPKLDVLSDGKIDTLGDVSALSEEIVVRKMQLKHTDTDYEGSLLLRVLAYLYTRPDTIINPLQHWNLPYLYTYYLLDVLAGKDEQDVLPIESLKQRNLVSQVDFVDRVRHCAKCNFAHFNFIDICPACKCIDIEKKPFLHCFACGTVAPQELFLKDNSMSCPQCYAQLRHIGADYDRPLENYICRACDHLFQEPEVTAHCQNCDKKSSPDELVPRSVYSYKLTERGKGAVRTGELEEVLNLLDELQNINPAHFCYTLNWLLKICKRHPEELFSLVGIRILNIAQLYKVIGQYRLIELVDSYISRVREMIRTTDLTTRMVDDTVWLLLPKTNVLNCDIVVSRILALGSSANQPEDVQLQLKTVNFTGPDNIINGESGEQLLARLGGGLK